MVHYMGRNVKEIFEEMEYCMAIIKHYEGELLDNTYHVSTYLVILEGLTRELHDKLNK